MRYIEKKESGSVPLEEKVLGPSSAQLQLRLDFRKMDLNNIPESLKYKVFWKGSVTERLFDIQENKEMIKTLSSPACLGDMILTCYKDHSRNGRLGLSLIDKFNLDHVLKDIGTVEGYLSTSTLYQNRKKFHIGKIVKTAHGILYNSNNPKSCLEKLFD